MNSKSILFFFVFCLITFQAISQIVSTQGFEATTYPPTGWSIKPIITPQNPWVRQVAPTTNPVANAHGGAAVSRFRRGLTAGTKQILVTRQIDYSNRGASAANLDFWMYRDSLSPTNFDSLTVWVNSTDTLDSTAVNLGTIARNRSISIPDTQAVNAWYHFTFAIPASFTGTTTRFIFEGTSGSLVAGQGANIFIDDISFDEFPAICTGIPNVGNIVNINPLICGGGGAATLNLSAPITGVLGITYSWEEASSVTGPWTATGSNLSNLNIASITSLTYYRCTVSCSFSSLSYTTPVDSIMISTNIPPSVVVTPGSAVFCAGSTGTLLVASGAVSYSWTPATSLNTSTGDSVMASPSSNTQYTVNGTDSVGCTAISTANITFNAGPTVSITSLEGDSVCVGDTVHLSTPNGTGYSFLWNNGITTRRDTIEVISDTIMYVMVTNTAGCTNTDSISITSIPPPVANFGWINTSGNTYNFTDSSIAASLWSWDFGDGNGSSNQNPTYTYSAPGTYTVTLINIGDAPCNISDTITKIIVVGPQSLSDINLNSNLKYYPNPVTQNLHIELNDQVINTVTIRNSVGQKIATYSNSSNSKTISIPTSSLTSGIYFAELTAEGQLYPFKFIKE